MGLEAQGCMQHLCISALLKHGPAQAMDAISPCERMQSDEMMDSMHAAGLYVADLFQMNLSTDPR